MKNYESKVKTVEKNNETYYLNCDEKELLLEKERMR